MVLIVIEAKMKCEIRPGYAVIFSIPHCDNTGQYYFGWGRNMLTDLLLHYKSAS